jgi:pimeloyl-ACP methyl ester carboxylesterase
MPGRGLRVAYQVTGEGPDLVMVPGLTSHLEIQWRDPGYRRFVRSLSSLCRLVRFDKPGTGLSDPVAEPPTLDERVADLMAVISAARCRRPVVLGFSDGGPVAVALAAAHRRSARALILYGTSPRRPPAGVMRQLREMARQWGHGDSLVMFAPTLAGDLARHDRAAFERASASPAMIRALVESLTDTDVQSRLAEVTVPTLVLHRRTDFVPLSEATLMARGIRRARLVELAGSDHLPWVGDVNGVLSPIAEFVGEVSGGRGKPAAAFPDRPPGRGEDLPRPPAGNVRLLHVLARRPGRRRARLARTRQVLRRLPGRGRAHPRLRPGTARGVSRIPP